jgi:nicotinamidase-related amidase
MPVINRESSALLVVDFQSRLMPVIEDAAAVVANAQRLLDGARLLDVPVLFTEENAEGLGRTLPGLQAGDGEVAHKMTFDACRVPAFLTALPDRPDIVICGCESHVCVLQTALGLLAAGRRVFAVYDAMGSRRHESKATAIRRLERNGAEIVTTEMVLFEWLATAEDPRLDRVLALVK